MQDKGDNISRSNLRSNSQQKNKNVDAKGRSRRNKGNKKTSFDLDNCHDDNERAIFDLIRGCPDDQVFHALSDHLKSTQAYFDLTALFNREGHTALTFAASENKLSACKCLISYVKTRMKEIEDELVNNSSIDDSKLSDSQVSGRL